MHRVLFCLFFLLAGSAFGQETAQPVLTTISLGIGVKSVTAEVADETSERTAGLMFREKLATDSGMLFVMPRAERATFWMKNTPLPLSIAYINPSGVILEIHDLEPHNEKAVTSAFPNIAYALEMEQGWFAKNKILPGDRVRGLPALTGR